MITMLICGEGKLILNTNSGVMNSNLLCRYTFCLTTVSFHLLMAHLSC